MRFDIATYSDKGPRSKNEDAWSHRAFDDNTVAVCVADGVGGNPCGQVASRMCADNFIKYSLKEQDLDKVVKHIDLDIKKQALSNPECFKMASTLSGCILSDNHLRGVHVGDTRIYILRGNGIKQLTQDHTEVARLVREKLISPAFARHYPRKNFLEMALGSENALKPFLFHFKLHIGDRIFLATDGVHGIIKKAKLRDMSIEFSELKDFSESVTNCLLESKLKDNVTFVVVQVNS